VTLLCFDIRSSIKFDVPPVFTQGALIFYKLDDVMHQPAMSQCVQSASIEHVCERENELIKVIE
ncbi:hypothetical protein L9F63_020176, partial [Diploptera punctata]